MLVRLLYTSRFVGADPALDGIFADAVTKNTRTGITGVLCVHRPQQLYIQLLEGSRLEVNKLYARICADSRHRDVSLLHFEEITERRFTAWPMGYVDLARINPRIVLRFFETPTLKPEDLPGRATLDLLHEMIGAAVVVSHREAPSGRREPTPGAPAK